MIGHTPRMFRALATIAALLGLSASAQAQSQCEVTPRDCAADTRALDQRIDALVAARTSPVTDALELVRLERRAACHAYNACVIDQTVLQRMSQWADGEIQAITRITDPRTQRLWASGLGTRLATARNAHVPAAQGAAPGRPNIPPETMMQLRASIAQMEGQLQDLAEFTAMVTGLEDQLATRRRRRRALAPAVCATNLRDRLRAMYRAGHSQASSANSLHRKLDELCEPFARWDEPDEALRGTQERFLNRIRQIEEWMADIANCHRAENYEFRCENTYGERNENAVNEARQVLELMAQARRATRGVPSERFPCGHRLWRRLRESTWTVRTATAQVPRLGQEALRVCERIGVDPESLDETRQEIRDELERTRARVAQQRAQTQQAVTRIRDQFGIED